MYYVIMMHEDHMTIMLKTIDYDTAYDVAHNFMIVFKREVLIVQSNKPPIIIKYVGG